MRAEETFDPECELLADHFLGDLMPDPDEDKLKSLEEYVAFRTALALAIQAAVETWWTDHEAQLDLFRRTYAR